MHQTGLALIAAPGPSLTTEAAARWRECPVICVGDGARMFPDALACYHGDLSWWRTNRERGTCWKDFSGAKLIPVQPAEDAGEVQAFAQAHGLTLVPTVDAPGFTARAGYIVTGDCSLFGAISYALGVGFARLVLIGCDMRVVPGAPRHFFGDHVGLRNDTNYETFVPQFERAAKLLPPEVQILNGTPESALTCFPFVELSA